ncbi:MFS family permease [Variovorax boronicumulans]|uniref:MFS family permease n=1 Tax=Variovorax boronicumulans TaxID=436515 RepID=A0AAW8D588_9BURK|nr:MFS transporter [Variovorax boronicumulans]MDP9895188.1 MFS family permease [Variovorax boronicumulans]MDQ0055006.1 MFS family permease [Variovorax boronicumulans]
MTKSSETTAHAADSRYAMLRLALTLLIMTVGSSGMYVVSVMLPAVQAEFGIDRADASLPYTWLMLGFGFGGVLMGRLADRFGVMWPLLMGSVFLGAGYIATGLSGGIVSFTIAQALLVGLLGSSAAFAPLVADTSLWFVKRRGIAVAVCASGNYVAGAIWPPIAQHFIETVGWRQTYIGMGIFCGIAMALLALFFRARPPAVAAAPVGNASNATAPRDMTRPFGLSTTTAQGLLCVAAVACCVAMAMPQVHIVAYCGDLGYGPTQGAMMLSLMLGFGVVSRLVSGAICDRIGGLRTLLLGGVLQCIALLLFLPFDGLVSLYVISALFGLFQGGLVPAYAIIVREHFPPKEAGARVGTVLMFSLFGMALGGWMSGKVFDVTGSYHAAFVNGIGWNLLNLCIASFLLFRLYRLRLRTPAGPVSA